MDDEALAHQVRGSAGDGHAFQLEGRARVAVGVRLEARHVAGVVLAPLRAVGLARGVVVPAGAHAVAGAAVALLVHVEAVLGVGLQSREARAHAHLVAVLREGHRSARGIAGGGREARRRRRFGRRRHHVAHLRAARRERGGHAEKQERLHGKSPHFFFASAGVPGLPVSAPFAAPAPGTGWAGAAAATIGVGFGMGLPAFFMLAW